VTLERLAVRQVGVVVVDVLEIRLVRVAVAVTEITKTSYKIPISVTQNSCVSLVLRRAALRVQLRQALVPRQSVRAADAVFIITIAGITLSVVVELLLLILLQTGQRSVSLKIQ
jgi:hypothetical protein